MFVLLLVIASLICLLVGIRFLRQALALTTTATSYIRSAAQGYVVLEGTGSPLPGRSIVAPFSGKPCVWWSTQVEPLLHVDPRIPNQHAFDKRSSTDLFMLKDGTGECLVDPTSAEVRAMTRETWYSSSMDVGSISQARRSLALGDGFSFTEERIELHQRIVGSGYFRTVDGDAQTHGIDGGMALNPGVNTLSQPTDGRRFLLSTIPEDSLSRQLRIRAALMLLSCVVLAGCALYASGIAG
ncbi:MAG TPA: hypothetical protein VGO35_08055 [Gammaproteobacteria bacterium]|jgi:hypothetical protein|nr:hypothetical protein [Gammaproteobacteria bacterium]